VRFAKCPDGAKADIAANSGANGIHESRAGGAAPLRNCEVRISPTPDLSRTYPSSHTVRAYEPGGTTTLVLVVQVLPPPGRPNVSFSWENDGRAWVLRHTSTDHFYSNGLRYTKTYDRRYSTPFVDFVTKPLRFFEGHSELVTRGVAIGHNIYTPTRIDVAAFQPTERPYAAWLYGGILSSAVNKNNTLMRSLELDLGVVGPGAGGHFFMTTAHLFFNGTNLGDAPLPQGWPNQISNRPAAMVDCRLAWRAAKGPADMIVSGDAVLGNVLTFGSGTLLFRLGWNVRPGFGPQPTINSAPPPAPAQVTRSLNFLTKLRIYELYAFGNGMGRAVAYDAFLDSKPPKAPPDYRIDKKTLVGEVAFGASARFLCEDFRVTWRRVRRSIEFEGQTHGGQTFGVWSFAVEHTF